MDSPLGRVFFFTFFQLLSVFDLIDARAQTPVFTKDYSWGHFPKKIAEDAEGNLLIAGSDYDYNTYLDYIFIEKLDKYGNLVWSRKIKRNEHHLRAYDLLLTRENTIYMLCTDFSVNYDSSKMLLIQLSDSGDLEWKKEYAHLPLLRGHSIQFQGDAHLLLSGTDGYDNYFGLNESVCLIKTDLEGNMIFGKQIKFLNSTYGYTLSTGDIGQVFLTGHQPGTASLAAAALDSNGNVKWSNRYLSPGNRLYSIKTIVDKNFLMGSGNVDYNRVFDPFDPMIFKIDTSGTLWWMKKIEADWVVAEGFNVFKWWDGNYLLHLEKEGGSTKSGFVIAAIDSAANIQWSKIYEPDKNLGVHMAMTGTRDSGIAGVSYQGENWHYHTTFKLNQFAEGCDNQTYDVYTEDLNIQTYPESLTFYDFYDQSAVSLSIADYSVELIVECEEDSLNTTLIENVPNEVAEIHISPNPFRESARIILPDEIKLLPAELRIFSADGKLCKKIQFTSHSPYVIKREYLPAGLYFYQLLINDQFFTGKIGIY